MSRRIAILLFLACGLVPGFPGTAAAQPMVIGREAPDPATGPAAPAPGTPAQNNSVFPPNTIVIQGPNLADRRYHACRETSDCAAVNPGCGASLVAINRGYADEVQGWYDRTHPKIACRIQADNARYVPVCNAAQQCAMAMPGSQGMPRPGSPGYCDVDTDCAVVTDACGRKTALNKAGAAKAQLPGNAADCSFMDTTVVQSLACENHLCRAHLLNH